MIVQNKLLKIICTQSWMCFVSICIFSLALLQKKIENPTKISKWKLIWNANENFFKRNKNSELKL